RAAGIDYRRRASELKADVITVEHLVTGGRRVFTPYFTNYITPHGYNIGKVADLQTEVTNSLFRRPQYTIDFYAVDNILDRQTGYAVEDIRGYLQRYIGILETFRFWTPERIMENFPGTAVMSGGELQDFIASFALTEGDFIDSLDLAENDFFDYYFTVPYFYREDAGYDVFMENRSRNNSDYHLVIPNEYYNGAHIFEDISRPAVFPNEYIAGEMAYYGFVREYYLQLPEELPPEILELTLEITRDLHTDYDKALAIEEYLAKNYEYTLSPSAPYDAGQDFVYNFLFDIKEGYCSYYATAMTVMMRLLGIPARESEGYLVDTRRITRDEDGNPAAIVVLDNNAHAWVEVYLRGIGWVPFEPTSSADEEEEPEEIRPYEYTPPARLPGTGEYMGTPEYEYDWDDDYEIPEQTDDVDLGRLYALIFGVVSAVLVIFAFYFINYGINKKRTNYFKTARPNAAALKMLVYLFNFLRLCGFNIRGDEGFTEFAGRVSRGFPMLRSEGWLNIMRIMQKARWSIHEISEEERNYACNFLTELREECLKNLKFGLKFKLRFVRFVI
ncbi:MAG: transglutaminase-like domain-containing protein, partial [Oscillospiraceae bacterium]|nr:transglutaminase-like domain-containing protein [Oscillospiraceae bacterium]